MKVCPKCGKEFKDDSLIFCPYCGSKLIDKKMMDKKSKISVCPYCGAKVLPDAAYCYKCGKPLPQILYSKADVYAKRGTKFGIIALLIFSPLGIGAFYYGLKARKLDKNKGLGGIILGMAALVELLIWEIILLPAIAYSNAYWMPWVVWVSYLIWLGNVAVVCVALYYIYRSINNIN